MWKAEGPHVEDVGPYVEDVVIVFSLLCFPRRQSSFSIYGFSYHRPCFVFVSYILYVHMTVILEIGIIGK